MSGFGLALLENGSGNNGVAIANNFGRTIMHAHPDLMNFDLFASVDFLSDIFTVFFTFLRSEIKIRKYLVR